MGYVLAVWGEFVNFIGGRSGILHWLLYVAALVCCFFLGKSERKKMVWPSLAVLFFFFNPFFYKYIGTKFLSGIYWRLLWMLPISFVIAYALIKLVYRIPKNAVRIGAVIVACACIIFTGTPVFSNVTYREKENAYEIPNAAITISDFIVGRSDEWKTTMIVPNELLCSIRQYSASACLLYGRNAGGFISDIGEDEMRVYEEMSKEKPDVAVITEVARQKNCGYIVFNTSFHQIPEDLSAYGYERLQIIEEVYVIYCRID